MATTTSRGPGSNRSPEFRHSGQLESDIRLLTIKHNQWECDLECTLKTCTFDQQPYNALSYCWRDAKGKVPISINGARFKITRNLKTALQRLRHET